MIELLNNSFKFRLVLGTLVILASLFMLPYVASFLWADNTSFIRVEAAPSTSGVANNLESPNVVSSGMGSMTDRFSSGINQVENNISRSISSTTATISRSSRSAVQTTQRGGIFIFESLQNRINKVGSGIGSAFIFMIQAPGKVFGLATKLPTLSSLIRPSDETELPVIDEQLTEFYASKAASQGSNSTDSQHTSKDATSLWPIHGRVTTLFGVPHRPYQVTHTGLDISSGSRSGITPVHAFRQGKVVYVVHSKRGLGNHLIVDHGDGLTSVYAHLYSISVKEGQEVDTNTVVGYEGSTGVSTGTHLHFEIRLNGEPVDPHKYISGQP